MKSADLGSHNQNHMRSGLEPFHEDSKDQSDLESHTQNHAYSSMGPFDEDLNESADLECQVQEGDRDTAEF